jgi:3-dehydroquinate synthase
MAQKIIVQGTTGKSTVYIGEPIERLSDHIPEENIIIITDDNVDKLYRKTFPKGHVIAIGTGESIKNLETVQNIYEALVAHEADRTSFIVGIGGGIVCDIAGFVASTYLRGVRFGFVSTTLLSQVDASVGGKNGVNFQGYKNVVGVFNQPEFVLCDLNLLKTLPRREMLCGFSEVVKHAAIGDADLFKYLEDNHEKAVTGDLSVIHRMVYDSAVIKSAVVNRDEREKGERRKLNFGHTIGHAVEKTTGMPHGQAVSLGMVVATEVSTRKNLLQKSEADRIKTLLKNLGLPTRFDIDRKRLLHAMRKDKKRELNRIHFVLLDAIGSAVVEEIELEEIETIMAEAGQEKR